MRLRFIREIAPIERTEQTQYIGPDALTDRLSTDTGVRKIGSTIVRISCPVPKTKEQN